MQSKWKTGRYNAHIYQGPRQHKTVKKKAVFPLSFFPFFFPFFSQLMVAQMIFSPTQIQFSDNSVISRNQGLYDIFNSVLGNLYVKTCWICTFYFFAM